MLVLVTGASGAGKTTAYRALDRLLEGRGAEFDQLGVPPNADTVWRQRATEIWVQRALDEPGGDLVLFGQIAPGELLAAPSATELDAVDICLLHCDPVVRRRRLLARGCASDAGADHLAFGAWMHAHTLDPRHEPEVITEHGYERMRWERWGGWEEGDARWAFEVLDTGPLTPGAVAQRLAGWIRTSLERRHEAPLSGSWCA